jgi:glucose/arabinose dehydrogenase
MREPRPVLGLLLVLGLGAIASAVAPACTERLPVALVTPEAGALPPPWGLDVRPVSTTCSGLARPTVSTTIAFERLSPVTFEQPVAIVRQGPRLYVVQQGRAGGAGASVRLLGADASVAPTVIDVSSRVVAGGESGLLGLAFHPAFAQNGLAYLYYTAPHPQQPPPAGVVFQSVIARYHSADGGLTLDPATETRILVVDQPFSNHNGGTIAFGGDGFLYLGLGDGGSGGDPTNAAQDPGRLLGKMLRIDVDGGDPYAVPADNPFAAGGGAPEIYALGLRNPYRFAFDAPTGDLWVGDVGQSAREEIDKVVLGGNYGWNIREGKACYKPASGCPTAGLIDPVVDHPRAEAVAIIGGVVYRGTRVPGLTGKYVYGDSGVGSLFAIATDQASPTPERLDVGLPRVHPVGFALDAAGEVVFADYGGILWRIAPPDPPAEMPAKLSATGCVDASDPSKPAPGLFPYDVNVPQWADGAIADRHLAVPADTKLTTRPDGRLELPPGSVAMRTVRDEGRTLETQLLLRRAGGEWAAFAYAWDADGKDATLASAATTVTTPSGRAHRVVERAACVSCHNDAAGVTLGLEAAQLDRTASYADREGNPLLTLDHLGMLSASVAADSYAALPALEGPDTPERRARAYLHANCAFCHQPSELATTSPRCASVLRMRATDASRMPPFASAVPHEAAIGVFEQWARGAGGCAP